MSTTTITKEVFGQTKDGKTVHRFTLQNGDAMTVQVITLGAAVSSIRVPDRRGLHDEVTLGFHDVQGYENNDHYFGVIIGRVANRIGESKFTLDGETYHLVANDGLTGNHLHGGPTAMSKQVWLAEVEGNLLRLSHTSPDGHENYPGEVQVHVTYQLTNENELMIDYSATTSKACPVNLTSHGYFNLNGHDSGDILDHTVAIYADRFTPIDKITMIPTGEISSVTGTLFDMRSPVLMRDIIHKLPGTIPGGNCNYCIDNVPSQKKLVSRVEHEGTGRVMETFTDQPAVQFYTASYINNFPGRNGAIYNKYCALCMESQNYPDAVNKPNFPNSVLRPGQTYRQTTWYKFSMKA